MRITRAYTITPEVKRILDTKPNKSDFVCRAVRKLHIQEDEFDLRDIATRRLLASLLSRDDLSENVKAVIRIYLELESTS